MTNQILTNSYSLETLFQISSQIAMLGWVILIFLPRGLKLLSITPQYIIPFGLSLTYSTLVLLEFFNADGGFSSLQSVKLLFQNDYALLAGWIHYLAFDLFIGAWIAREADKIGLSRILQAPILIATFMLGPIGLAIFLTMRSISQKMEEPKYA